MRTTKIRVAINLHIIMTTFELTIVKIVKGDITKRKQTKRISANSNRIRQSGSGCTPQNWRKKNDRNIMAIFTRNPK